jgi:adenylate cyclase
MPIAPLYKLALADVYRQRGTAEDGLRVIDETLAGMAVTGERVWHSEFHRLKGELLLVRSSSNHQAAETCFRQALEIARVQGARSWQMRAATSLGRLLVRQNRAHSARQIVSDLYNSFTEGLETTDLRDAKRLLDEVSNTLGAMPPT